MCNDTTISQENIRYSFFQLFNGRHLSNDVKYNLVIPIIQRDYAQGRKNEKTNDVRNDFLSALYEYIEDSTCQSHDLDFVYGYSIDSTEARRKLFVPLDGQQRLTTLFLLHWYLAQRTKKQEDKESFFNAITQKTNNGTEIKSRFSYRTRISSADFCDKLVQAKIDLSQLLKIKKGKQEIDSLSATIQDTSWFSPNWMQDPTISSMLTMLDSIHDKFKDVNHTNFLERLMNDTNPAVTFIFMNLDDYDLSDDLYIKMNSRGKPLTPFENFKAKFEQYIAKVQNESVFENRRRSIEESYNKKESTISSVKQYFSFKLDTDWTNLMWAYCKDEITGISQENQEKTLENLLDKKLANFIRVILTNQLAADLKDEIVIDESGLSDGEIKQKKQEEKEKRDELYKILIQDNQRKYISYNLYEKSHGLSPAGVEYLISAFDVLANGKEKIKTRITESRYFNENDIFNLVINDPSQNTLTYPSRIRFHAYIKYLILFNGDDDKYLNEWMHFVYSITENTITDTPERFSLAIVSINALLQKMTEAKQPSVYDFFISLKEDFTMSYFASYQVKEEQIKAHLFRKKDQKWKSILEKLEKHPYFNQQIGFLLEFAGIVDFYDQHKNCNWETVEDDVYYYDLLKYGDVAQEIFKGGYANRVFAKDAIFERAMLIRYPVYIDSASYNRYNMLTSTAGGNTERDHSWRVLLRIDGNDEKRDKRDAVKCMFGKLWLKLDYKIDLEEYIKNNINNKPSWIRALVRDETNIAFCKNGFFRKDKGYYLQSGEKTRNEDVELFTYTLFNSYPNDDWGYIHARYDNDPHIEWRFVFDNKNYAVCIHTIPGSDDDFDHYQFVVRDVSCPIGQMPQELENTLSFLGFTRAAGLSYERFVKDNNETDFLSPNVVGEFKSICSKLEAL